MTNLTNIQNYLREQPDIILTYIQGSLQGNTAMPDSDYDLIIVTETPLMPQRRTQLEQHLATILDSPFVVLVALNHKPHQRSYAIVTEATPLFDRDLAHRIAIEQTTLNPCAPPPDPSPPPLPTPPDRPTTPLPIPQSLYT